MASFNNKFTEADKLYIEAKELLDAGEIANAARLFVQLTERYDDYGMAWSALGNIMLKYLEDPEGAEECFKKAIEVSPVYGPAYLAYAEALFTLEKFAEMNAILNQASSIRGVRKDLVLKKSAILMESQGRYDEAISSYKKAIIASFSDEEIRNCEQGISRCIVKQRYV